LEAGSSWIPLDNNGNPVDKAIRLRTPKPDGTVSVVRLSALAGLHPMLAR
jgi:hypothetical protein